MQDLNDDEPRVALTGSYRGLPSAERVGSSPAGAVIEVTVYLRGPQPSPGRLLREEYSAAHGASRDDIELVRTFASAHGLTVGPVDTGRRSMQLSGPLGAMEQAFEARTGMYRDLDGQSYRGLETELSVPVQLDGIVTGVFGLDERPQAQAHFRSRDGATNQYTPPQVAQAYHFQEQVTGAGEVVALIELGGGFRQEDLTAYFTALGIDVPAVEAVDVGTAKNSPSTADGPDMEVMLAIEVVGSVAPGASVAIYFAANTTQGFIDAVSTAVHDAQRKPSVVSISWGSSESTWASLAMQQMEQDFVAAAAMGVTVTVASGDSGSGDGVDDGLAHVDFPASAPHALACGGTRLELANGQTVSETVWDDGAQGGAGGGGVSTVFAVPTYQAGARVPASVNPGHQRGRGVPDVCGDADPGTGYRVRVDGGTTTVGGTSAVAPLWAGLIALLNHALGKPVGFVHPFVYSAAGVLGLHDITSGSNGAYSAGPGWDACTGLGSPDGTVLLEGLEKTTSKTVPH